MCQYLERRSNGTYYFRRPIPRRLQPEFENRVQWMFSLRTKDRDDAKRLAAHHTLQTQNELDRAAADMAGERPEKAVQRPRARSAPWARAAFEHDLEAARIGEAAHAEADAILDEYGSDAEAMEEVLSRPIRQVPEEHRATALAFQHVKSKLALAEEERGRWQGRYGRRKREQEEAAKAATPGPVPEPAPATDGLTLLQVAGRLATERGLAAKTSDAQKAVARWFDERMGQMPVASITRKHVLEFKDKLLAEGQSATNINVKIGRLATLLAWAADNDHTSENVALRIRVQDANAGRDRRRPFDLASLNAIFSSPVFTAGERPTKGRGEAAYWLPLLALFTGGRLEELAQLRVADVRTVEYPDADGAMLSGWFLHITESEEDGLQLKNAGSERLVPIHAELERLGFLAYVKTLPKDGRLFPDLRPGAYGRLGSKWGEWFTSYRRSVGVTDRRLVFHSFRHAFKDYLRAAGVEDGVQRALMGHKGGDVADSYGSGYGLQRLVEGMRRYRVPKLLI